MAEAHTSPNGQDLLNISALGIRQKLAIAFSLLIVLVMLLTVFLVTRQEKAASLERALANGRMLGATISLGLGENIVRSNFQGLDYFLRRFADQYLVRFCFIVTPRGKVISSTEPDMAGKFVNDPWSIKILGSEKIEIRRALYQNDLVYDTSVPVRIGGETWGLIRIGFSLAPEREYIRQLLLFNLSLGLLFILVGIFIAYALSTTFLAPITDLLMATEKIGKGEFHFQTQIRTSDEFEQLGSSFNRMTRELAKKARLRKYVSQAAWEEIEADTGEIVRGGRREDVAVLFSDIQGFTTFTERHQPEEVVDYLNRFFDYMVLAIVEAGGIVDKFIGDCVMGVFLPTPDQKRPPEFRSVLAALRMKRNLADFNLGQAQLGLQEFQTGVGLNGGPVVLGNVGAASRLEFTVLGDTVNLASRLESESREGTSTKIYLSGVLYHRVRELVDARLVGEKQVKGKQQSVEIYEVTGLRNIPFFREQFGSAPVPARIEILQICGLSRVPEGRDFLIEVAGLGREELAVRGEALRALGGFVLLDDGPARAFLRETVGKNEDEALVGVAVAALALARDDSLGPLFGDLLSHPRHRVRANAVEALLVLLIPDKRDLLKRAARDPHPRVCANALLGLWILEDPDVLYGLLDMLDAPEAPRRSSGAYAVGTLASARSFRLLFEGLPPDGGGEPVAPGKPPVESRFPNAARILARLRKMLQGTDASERRQATRSLALIGDAQCAQELVKLLESESDPNVRYELEQTVQKLRHRSVPGALRRGVG